MLLVENRVSKVKEKYDIPHKSVTSGYDHYFGDVGPADSQNVFNSRWGWKYNNARKTFTDVKKKYKNTLLSDYHSNDPYKGALKSYDFGEY